MSALTAAIIGSSIIGAGASLFGASAQADAAEAAARLQMDQFQQTRRDLKPWRVAGAAAITELADLIGLPIEGRIDGGKTTGGTPDRFVPIRQGGHDEDKQIVGMRRIPGTPGTPTDALTREERQDAAFDRFETSPGYEFRLEEGINALDKSAAARGRLNSGAQGRALVRYGEGLAASEYADYWNRLAGLAGVGQQAATNLGEFGTTAARNAGIFTAGAGTARASGYTGAANVLTGGAQDLAYFNWLGQQQLQYIP